MNIKRISLLMIFTLSTILSGYAQVKNKPFRGTIVYQVVVETKGGPDGSTPQSMQANFRITCDKDRFGIDSITLPAPIGSKISGAKVMIERSGLVTAGIKKDDEYKGVYFSLKKIAEQQLSKMKDLHKELTEDEMKKRMAKLDSMGLKPVFTVTNETQTISDFPCRKIMVKMGPAMIDMWVTEKLNTNLKDYFTEIAATINGKESDYKKMAEMSMKYYNIPPELKNATPVRIIVKINKDAADSKNAFASMAKSFGGVMINIVNVGSRVDASAFDFSQYKLVSADDKLGKSDDHVKDDSTTPPASKSTPAKTQSQKKPVKN